MKDTFVPAHEPCLLTMLAPPGRRRESAVVITRDDPFAVLRIAAELRRLGGLPYRHEPRRYEFGSEASRDRALMALRSDYGWTSVEAAEAQPDFRLWLSAR